MKPIRFLVILCIALTSICITMATFVFVYDPLLYYRIPEDRLIVNNYRFINPGLIKNAEYDTAIIGSSMIQNFDMDQFRTELDQNPIKVSVGAMSIQGMKLSYDFIQKQGKAKTIYVAIDIPSLAYADDDLSSYATYLYDQNPFNDYRYLLGYETWMRLLPLNIGFSLLDRVGYTIPSFYASNTLDQIGDWSQDYTFGEDIVKSQYLESPDDYVDYKEINLTERLETNTAQFLELFGSFESEEYVFFFPPYSMLFWYTIEKQNALDAYLHIKQVLIDALLSKSNVSVFDFQSMPETLDLNHYKDYTHYGPEVNTSMVNSFKNKYYQITTSEAYKDEALRDLLDQFIESNSRWLE